MLIADTFKALGDPVRLVMIERLSDGKPQTVGGISGGLGLTRQGARKHLQVLANVKLVNFQTKGRQTEVSLETANLAVARSFITELELRWDRRLKALQAYTEKTP